MELISIVMGTGLSEESLIHAQYFADMIVRKKIQESSTEKVCLVLCDEYGTVRFKIVRSPHHDLAEKHTLVHIIKISNQSGNCIEDVMGAMDCVDSYLQEENKVFSSKHMLLLTQLTDSGYKYSDDQIHAVVSRIKKSETKLAVIDLTTQKQQAGQDILNKIIEDVNGLFYSFSEEETEYYDQKRRGRRSKFGPISDFDHIIDFILGSKEDKSKQEKYCEVSIPKEEIQAVEEQNVKQSIDENKDKEPVPDEVAPDGGAAASFPIQDPGDGRLRSNVGHMIVNPVPSMQGDSNITQNRNESPMESLSTTVATMNVSSTLPLPPDYLATSSQASEDRETSSSSSGTSKEADMEKGHVMISYQWDQQKKALWIKEQLENNGFITWMDIENMGQKLHTSMAKAVEEAHVVLVCMSEKYNKSSNCEEEALYARDQRKIIIPLKMEDFKPVNWLGIMTVDYLYYDFSGKKSYEEEMKNLLKVLAGHYKQQFKQPDITPFDSFLWKYGEVSIPKEEVQAVEGQSVKQSIDENRDKEPVPDEVASDGGAEAALPIQEKHSDISIPKEEAQAEEEQNVEQSMDENKDKEPVFDEGLPSAGAGSNLPTQEKLHRNVLNRCLPALVRNIDFQMVSMYMPQNKGEVHHLSENKTESDKIRELIARIQEEDKDTYEEFKECLVKAEQSYLKDMLEEHEKIETRRCTVNLSDNKDRSATKIEESDERSDKKGHVMISYSLAQKEKALWIKTQLENNGYSVWVVDENMQDSIADAMERAHVVLLCMSETYSSSINCQKVALYRNGKRKVIIPLQMEDFTPHGFLESLVIDNIYYNFCGKSPFEDEMKKLLQELASYYIKDLEESTILPFDIVEDVGVPVPSATPPIQVETSVLSEIIMSVRIDNQDVKMTSKELEEALAAGPDDAKATRIVDSILEQGDEKLKTLVLKYLSKLLTNEMASVEKHKKFMIWPATKLSQGETIFVCLHKDKLKAKLKNFFNITIFYKSFNSPAPLIDLKNPDDLKWTVPAEEDALLIQSVIEEHSNRLFSEHSNLQVICGGCFMLHERQQFVEKKTTIILYCDVKGYKPYGEKEFPSSLAYAGKVIGVDVREGYFALAAGDKEWHKILTMGISIGIKDDIEVSGTLGPIVKVDEGHGFITCAHVVGITDSSVVQPAYVDQGEQQTENETICGHVKKWVFSAAGVDRRNGLVKVVGLDAALVKLNDTRPVAIPPKFPLLPKCELSKMGMVELERELQYTGDIEYSEDFVGKTVIKYGKKTGFRIGEVVLQGSVAKIHQYNMRYEMWNNEIFLMRGLYVIKKRCGQFAKQFAKQGDSGAGVFLIENGRLTLIGLVIGVLDSSCDYNCLAIPIEHVLRALNVTKEQLQFKLKDSNK